VTKIGWSTVCSKRSSGHGLQPALPQ
jgi:hypothetical protein